MACQTINRIKFNAKTIRSIEAVMQEGSPRNSKNVSAEKLQFSMSVMIRVLR